MTSCPNCGNPAATSGRYVRGLCDLCAGSTSVDSALEALGEELGLVFQIDVKLGGVTHEYLYSPEEEPTYRYAFARWWGRPDLSAAVVWVLLNPSTGDTELRPRPTLERCTAWSKTWGAQGLVLMNLFAIRHPEPQGLRTAEDPVGPLNDRALFALTSEGQRTVVAWGSHGRLRQRSSEVATVLREPVCLGFSQDGEPRHPLYAPWDAELVPWAGPGGAHVEL